LANAASCAVVDASGLHGGQGRIAGVTGTVTTCSNPSIFKNASVCGFASCKGLKRCRGGCQGGPDNGGTRRGASAGAPARLQYFSARARAPAISDEDGL
jgi:hypothetical protein